LELERRSTAERLGRSGTKRRSGSNRAAHAAAPPVDAALATGAERSIVNAMRVPKKGVAECPSCGHFDSDFTSAVSK
jgi:hypothetical protein